MKNNIKITIFLLVLVGISLFYLMSLIPVSALSVNIPIKTNYTLLNTNYSLDSDKLDGQHGSYYMGYCDSNLSKYAQLNTSYVQNFTGNQTIYGYTTSSIGFNTLSPVELIKDYSFDDKTKWQNGSWWTIVGGNAVSSTSSPLGYTYLNETNPFTVVPGRIYLLSFGLNSYDATYGLNISIGGVDYIPAKLVGNVTWFVKAVTNANLNIVAVGTWNLSYISIKEFGDIIVSDAYIKRNLVVNGSITHKELVMRGNQPTTGNALPILDIVGGKGADIIFSPSTNGAIVNISSGAGGGIAGTATSGGNSGAWYSFTNDGGFGLGGNGNSGDYNLGTGNGTSWGNINFWRGRILMAKMFTSGTSNQFDIYTNVNITGNITYTDTYWDDLTFPTYNLKINAATNKPDEDTEEILYLFDDASVETVRGSGQTSHSQKNNTPLYCHIHWLQEAVGSVNWTLNYSLSRLNSTVQTWSLISTNNTLYNYTTGQLQQMSYFNVTTNITDLSSIFRFKLSRIGDATYDTMVGDAHFESFDCHYQISQVGSRDEYRM